MAVSYFDNWIAYCPIPPARKAGAVSFSVSYDKSMWTSPFQFTYVAATNTNNNSNNNEDKENNDLPTPIIAKIPKSKGKRQFGVLLQ